MNEKTYNVAQEGMVQEMRKIRDQISIEIKDMTFEEERAYLATLLSTQQPNLPNPIPPKVELTVTD